MDEGSSAPLRRPVPLFTRHVGIALLFLTIAVVVVHWPALHSNGLSFDDDGYVGYNALVTKPSWDSARRFLTELIHPSTIGGYSHPLAMISLMMDYAAGGRQDHVLPFRITSLILHTGTTLLVCLLLYLLFGQIGPATLVALLFGVHPLTVEVIVWIAQRKAVLAGFFSVAAMVLYTLYVQRTRWLYYVASLLMFLLALMSKPSSTPLPALLLLLDFWPLRRLSWRFFWEKIPFFILGGVGATIIILSHTATLFIKPAADGAGQNLLALMFYKLAFYADKIFWPHDLSSYYSAPKELSPSNPLVRAGAFGVFLVIAICAATFKKWRGLSTGIAFFFICLFPALGIFGYSWVFAQDNYVYLPMVGLLLPLTALLTHLWSSTDTNPSIRLPRHIGIVFILLPVIVGEIYATRLYLPQWKDTLTLHRYMVALAPDGARLRYNYGWVLNDLGRKQEAEQEYRKTIELDPNHPEARYSLATLLYLSDRFEEAAEHLRVAARLTPGDIRTHILLGHTLMRLNQPVTAADAYRQALAIVPNDLEARVNLAAALNATNRTAEAVEEIKRAIQLQQNDAQLYYFLGQYSEHAGKPQEAIEAYRHAVTVDPTHAAAQDRLKALLNTNH